jgi:hypothetical protein
MIELIAVAFFLKETNLNKAVKKINYNPFSSIIKSLKDSEVSLFIISFFTLILSFSLYQ